MLYHLLEYNVETQIGLGIEAVLYNPDNMEFLDRFVVGLYSPIPLEANASHSFVPCNYWDNNIYIKGTYADT